MGTQRHFDVPRDKGPGPWEIVQIVYYYYSISVFPDEALRVVVVSLGHLRFHSISFSCSNSTSICDLTSEAADDDDCPFW